MNTRILPVLALCLVGSVAGCGNGNPVDRGFAQADALFDFLCANCPAALGTTTSAECLAAAEDALPSPTQVDCIRNVYNANSTELAPIFDCSYAATTNYDRCMRTAVATCPPSSSDLGVCSSTYSMALSACPRPSSGVEAMLTACNPVMP